MRKKAEDFLPLTETTYLILAALKKVGHGYGIMQTVSEVTKERIVLAPGTLYGALSKLTKDGLIKVKEDYNAENSRKKEYTLTGLGEEVVNMEYERLEILVMESQKLLGGNGYE